MDTSSNTPPQSRQSPLATIFVSVGVLLNFFAVPLLGDTAFAWALRILGVFLSLFGAGLHLRIYWLQKNYQALRVRLLGLLMIVALLLVYFVYFAPLPAV